MERYTKKSDSKGIYVTEGINGLIEGEGYYGDAIERLAKFENLNEHLINRQKMIPVELESLRNSGKSKTVTFKELLSEKMVNEMILTKLEI